MLSLMQDRKGFIWVGTHTNGLYRYNGYQAVKYINNPADPTSLPHDRVSAIFEDKQGRIWAATQNGLARFNPETNNFTTFSTDKAPKNHRIVKNIIADGKDGLWIGTWGGLQHFDPNSGKFDAIYAHDDNNPDSLASNDLNALALDAKGGLWIGTWPGGMDYLAPGAKVFKHHQVDPAPSRMPASTSCARCSSTTRRAVDRHRVRRHPLGRQERLGYAQGHHLAVQPHHQLRHRQQGRAVVPPRCRPACCAGTRPTASSTSSCTRPTIPTACPATICAR
jgi:streptogramin lyase